MRGRAVCTMHSDIIQHRHFIETISSLVTVSFIKFCVNMAEQTESDKLLIMYMMILFEFELGWTVDHYNLTTSANFY